MDYTLTQEIKDLKEQVKNLQDIVHQFNKDMSKIWDNLNERMEIAARMSNDMSLPVVSRDLWQAAYNEDYWLSNQFSIA